MYAFAPFIAWLVAGLLKFAINHFRYGNAKERIGNGGFPSNHTTIVTTTTMLIGFGEGFNSPMFGLGAALTFIVIIDATGLRRHVGRHAAAINLLQPSSGKLRESMGHNAVEVLGGLAIGTLLGYLLAWFS
jgi:uncharacterized protein